MKLTKQEVAKYIQDFLDGTGNEWDWDDFISIPISNDPYLENIRIRCCDLPDESPPQKKYAYCGPEGKEYLKMILKELQKGN